MPSIAAAPERATAASQKCAAVVLWEISAVGTRPVYPVSHTPRSCGRCGLYRTYNSRLRGVR